MFQVELYKFGVMTSRSVSGQATLILKDCILPTGL